MTPAPVPATPIEIRFNRGFAIAFIVAGVLNLLLYVLPTQKQITGLLLGVLFVGVGVLWLRGKAFVVQPHEVQAKNAFGSTMKSYPIDGLNDLVFDKTTLRQRSSGSRIASMGWVTDRGDREALAAAIAAARPLDAPPGPVVPPT